MPWLKRNLALVAAAAVAVVLLGVAGYFLYAKIQKEREATANLQGQTDELNRLMNLTPHPGTEKINNIQAAKDDEKRLQEFLQRARVAFQPVDCPTNLDAGQFSVMLAETVDELRRMAAKYGTKLPEQFAFGFSGQKTMLAFDASSIQPLAMELMEIRVMSKILLNSKILALDSIKRVPIGTQDSPSAPDILGRRPSTNDLAILMPYEFTFSSFSAELASVLQGFYTSPHALLVKNLVIDRTLSPLLGGEATDTTSTAYPGQGMAAMNSMYLTMMRYGGRYGRYGIPPPMQAPTAEGAPTMQPTTGPSTVVDESPFRVVLIVDVVRMLDKTQAKPGGRGRGARGAPVSTPDGSDPAAAPAEPLPGN